MSIFRSVADWISSIFRARVDVQHGISTKRSDKWPTVRRRHLKEEKECQWCRVTAHVEVHHIKPFHLHPELELDDKNLITLCEGENECHLKHGHLGDWKGLNLDIREQCDKRGVNPV
jgi:5-methylcytosine-specific restriction endonuclease McrA